MKRIRLLVSLSALLLGATLVAPPAGAAHGCAHRWGSLEKTSSAASTAQLVDVRTGRHACFDRLVLDLDGAPAGSTVRYVDAVHQGGSGNVVPVRGGARLEVVSRVDVRPTDSFFLPNGELSDVSSFRTFRHVAWGGSFEAQTVIGLGVRARLPFRVLALPGPGSGSRLVVDVAHRW